MNKKPIRIVHKNYVTKLYDCNGVDLTEKMSIARASVEFDAAARRPILKLEIHAPDIIVEMDDVETKVKQKELYYVDQGTN